MSDLDSDREAETRQRRRPLITVIIPVFNEEENVERAYNALVAVFRDRLPNCDLELLFSDNHSSDGTFALLSRLASIDERVKVLRLNRNYGFQRSLLTAYGYASGDAAVQIDCDLQDPPELIADFVELWRRGHDMVAGVRVRRRENAVLTAMRGLFYALLNRISEEELTPGAGDFRLVDRALLNELRAINDRRPFVRGVLSFLARNPAAVTYAREARRHGRSKFPLRRLFGFALDGIFGQSTAPLRMMSYFGFLTSLLAFGLGLFYFGGALLVGDDWPSGFATITVLLLMGIGINGIFLGVIGEYIGRIYEQMRYRPLTVVETRINLDGTREQA